MICAGTIFFFAGGCKCREARVGARPPFPLAGYACRCYVPANSLKEVVAVKNAVNWLLIGMGGILLVAEVLLGAVTGFDLALVGISLAAGGGIGLYFGSAKVGLFSSGALAFVYLAFFRRWLRSRLTVPDRPTNVDALIGRTGVVTVRLEPNVAGEVKLGDEAWRAVLAPDASVAREPGETVRVESVEGVTLKVR